MNGLLIADLFAVLAMAATLVVFIGWAIVERPASGRRYQRHRNASCHSVTYV